MYPQRPEEGTGPLEPALQAIVSHTKWILRTEHGSWHRKPDPGNWEGGGGEVSGFIFSQGQSSNPGFTYASVLLLSCIPQTCLLIGPAINGTESRRRQMLVRTWAACLTPLLEPPVPLFKAKLCYTAMNILPKTSCAFIIYTKNFTNMYLYASML